MTINCAANAHTACMVKLKWFAAAALAAACAALCGCGRDTQSSLKELTDPYITRYECTLAEYGGQDFLERFDYIRVTLTDKENMELSYKYRGEEPKSYTCTYEYDEKTGELSAEAGFLGVNYNGKVNIENGKFTFSYPLAGRQLIMRFES